MKSSRRTSILIMFVVCAFIVGCGSSLYDSPSPAAPGEKPFIAKGKLKSDMEAKAKLKTKGTGVGK